MKQLQHDIDNVKNEAKANIITIKKILIREKIINEDNFELLSKYSPVMFFSIWEGFFKESIKSYFEFFNRNKNFKRDLLMLTSISEHHNIIADNYSRFDSKKNLLSHIQNLFEKPEFEVKRPHINPTSFNDMNTFLKRIKINPINKKSRFKYNSLVMKIRKNNHVLDYDFYFLKKL